MRADAAAERERQRVRRLRRLLIPLGALALWMWWRVLQGRPVTMGWPQIPDHLILWLPAIGLIVLLGVVLIGPMLGNARSPHVTYLPEQIEVGFDDVKGLGPVLDEVRHTLRVLLDYRIFREQMGGRPRRGVLFEGPPGTGKTHVAKAMAKEAGVPFLFVSSTAFQSMWYGMTARRIRSYFRALRKTARREGGAIGFIEEIDAIGLSRGSHGHSTLERSVSASMVEGTGGVVNELLIQMQSFDEPTFGMRVQGWLIDLANRLLPPHLWLRKRPVPYANILLIGATNRASLLDSALLRPGRFDRILHFDRPGRSSRRELVDYFLARKAHVPELDTERARGDLAASTLGHSPASLERLFDEALLLALRHGRQRLSVADLRQARMEIEIGLAQPVEYPAEERDTIAVHEAGHAVVAYLVGKGRRLEVLSIVKRKEALGLLAHRDSEERFTRRRGELVSMLQIALGGMVAEELFFGESGTGPAGDLATATDIAVEMVGALGLGGSLVSFRALDTGRMGGNLANRVLADRDARKAVDAILQDNKQAVTHLLGANRHLVEALRAALLEREELVDDEILEVLRRAQAEARPGVVVDLREMEPSYEPAIDGNAWGLL
ncbi:MAG: AAA family ATPase [Actinomycetota bacterium]|nr:AAA family ATPase [Actinomycetota bacterium]